MSRPVTLFTGQWADLPFEEVVPARLGVGLRRPRDRLLGRPPRRLTRRRRGRRYVAEPARDPGEVRPRGLGDLQPPQRPGRLRRPDRRPAPRHPARPGLGRRRPRGRPAARGRGDEADRARGPQLGVDTVVGFTGSSIWQYVAMFPPVPQALIDAGYQRLRRPLEPDPRRVRRGGRAVRARGAPQRDRLRLLDDRAHAGGDRPPPGVRPELGPEPLRLAGPRPGRLPLGLPRPDLPRGLQGREAAHAATAATAGSARTCPGPTRAAAGTSSPPAAATCRGRTASGC